LHHQAQSLQKKKTETLAFLGGGLYIYVRGANTGYTNPQTLNPNPKP
jgi:hypothetical protein